MAKACGDEIRGVGQYHSRMHAENERELDRMYQEHGEPAPWMDNEPEIPRDQFAAMWELMHALIAIGDRARRIFFARLQGLTWADIGLTLLRGASPQAAENEMRKVYEQHPMLARAFPERQKKERT